MSHLFRKVTEQRYETTPGQEGGGFELPRPEKLSRPGEMMEMNSLDPTTSLTGKRRRFRTMILNKKNQENPD